MDNVDLAERVQNQMINAYSIYITNSLIKKDISVNVKIKGTPSGKKGRPSIRPEQSGHDVKISGTC
eukprot:3716929-Heterocapsa_arctica.AAC.1